MQMKVLFWNRSLCEWLQVKILYLCEKYLLPYRRIKWRGWHDFSKKFIKYSIQSKNCFWDYKKIECSDSDQRYKMEIKWLDQFICHAYHIYIDRLIATKSDCFRLLKKKVLFLIFFLSLKNDPARDLCFSFANSYIFLV